MTITLPEEIREEVERKAKLAGFADVELYLAELVRADDDPIAVPKPPLGSRYSVGTREELEAKLLEGMNTAGDVIASPNFWELRRIAAEERTATGERRFEPNS
jgi:hypothetical protein